MSTTQQTARIKAQRAHVAHCHEQLQGWRDNRDPMLKSLREFAVSHYAEHKRRALNQLQALVNQ